MGDGDRRASPRYSGGSTSILLIWSEGENNHELKGQLRDLSMNGGAALTAWEPSLSVGARVWFHLEHQEGGPWLAAKVVGVSKKGFLRKRARLIRWMFEEPCNYDIFKRAISDFSRDSSNEDVETPGFDRRDWRD